MKTRIYLDTSVFGAVCVPWRDGVLYVLQFHAARVGGGMSWQAVWSAFTWIDTFADLSAVRLFLSAQIGTLTLTGCLLIAFGAQRLDPLNTSPTPTACGRSCGCT